MLRKGGVHAAFSRLMDQLSPLHDITVLSQPPAGPWVVVVDDFLSEHEIRAMVEKGGHHFERSLAGDGVTAVRTSSTSWCNVPICEDDPIVKQVRRGVLGAA